MISEEELRSKRIYVGVLAVLFLAAGLGLMVFQPDKDGMQGALMRVALLLGAFWLAMPTKSRPAAWSKVSPLTVGIAIVSAMLLPRLRYLIPVIIAVLSIGWFVRPRQKKEEK